MAVGYTVSIHMDSSVTLPTRFVEPDVVVSHFHIRSHDTVADLGAGSGYFLPALAAAVGPDGRVYAAEIQKNLVERLGDTIRAAGWSQMSPLWCDIEAPENVPIPAESVDVAIMVNTLFLLEDKAAAVATIDHMLRPNGRVCVVDWTESFQGLGPSDDMVVTQAAATDLFEGAAYALETTFPAGAHHYGLLFRKL